MIKFQEFFSFFFRWFVGPCQWKNEVLILAKAKWSKLWITLSDLMGSDKWRDTFWIEQRYHQEICELLYQTLLGCALPIPTTARGNYDYDSDKGEESLTKQFILKLLIKRLSFSKTWMTLITHHIITWHHHDIIETKQA